MLEKKIIPFGEKSIGSGKPIIIAEIGVNHEGDIKACENLVREAAKAGADAVKFQTVDADENYVKGTESYQIFKSCALTQDETAKMFDLARKLKMEVFTTAGDFKTIDWVDKLEPAAHKISSGLLTSHPIVDHVCTKGRSMLLSTGLASSTEIDETIDIVRNYKNIDYGIFQCTSKYPTPDNEVNLAAIPHLAERYKVPIGLSDHSDGIEASVLSIASGAVMLERHFSLDKNRPGFDHKVSLDTQELTELIYRVNKAYEYYGVGEKLSNDSISEMRSKMNRCLVARVNIKKGEVFTKENLGIKRPFPENRGLDPKLFKVTLGKRAQKSLQKDESIYAKDVE